jgi:hypothetical protein
MNRSVNDGDETGTMSSLASTSTSSLSSAGSLLSASTMEIVRVAPGASVTDS